MTIALLATSIMVGACGSPAVPGNPTSPPSATQQSFEGRTEMELAVLKAFEDEPLVFGAAYHNDPERIVLAVLEADGKPSEKKLDELRATAAAVVGDIPIEFDFSSELPREA
ncbi:hypothetical protein [Tessaracoccus caeni]|uniref:hypothetical protein n=1 Tax=Tessaracoccus caeni TaxID=3031239 RepID=UPI0023DCD269|nr:hypothetical protein [Tessaracoccus caeni]MDF1486815.1 hypothetical protein [Tessaracoccus caeni]